MLCTNNLGLLLSELRALGEPPAPAQLPQLRCLQLHVGWHRPVVGGQPRAPDPFLEGQPCSRKGLALLRSTALSLLRPQLLFTGDAPLEPVLCAARALPA